MPAQPKAIERAASLGLKHCALLVLALAVLGPFVPDYELLGLNQHLLLALNVLALNFCLGLGGQASLAQGAFCGLGAYFSVLAHQVWPEASPLILACVALSAWGIGFGLSYPMEKLGEGFLAMATLGLSLIFTNLAVSLSSITGGPDGMLVTTPLSVLGLNLRGDIAHYYVFLVLLAGGLYLFLALRHSRLGRALLACKSDPMAAAACGIRRPAARSLSFGLGAALSALAGAVYAPYGGFISPGEFDLELSLKTLLYLVIGGPGNPVRPILAVLGLESLLSHAHFLGDTRTLFHGLLLGAALLAPVAWKRLRRK
jgi:branched-chain amino acid transport system permease protein